MVTTLHFDLLLRMGVKLGFSLSVDDVWEQSDKTI